MILRLRRGARLVFGTALRRGLDVGLLRLRGTDVGLDRLRLCGAYRAGLVLGTSLIVAGVP